MGLLGLSGCVTPQQFGGPIPVRNQHPIQLTVLALNPNRVQTLPVGDAEVGVDLAYTSLFLESEQGTSSFTMDGEVLRAGLRASFGLPAGFEIAWELPMAITSGGFLDSFIDEFHDTFNQRDGGRTMAPRDRFLVSGVAQGNPFYEMRESAAELLDVPIELRWQALRPDADQPFGLLLRAAVELPTGDQDEGYGNGGLDIALGVVGQVRLGPVALAAHLGQTFVSTPDRARQAGVDYRDVRTFGASIEAALTPSTAAIVQVDMSQMASRGVRSVNIDSDQWLLWVGLRSRWTENLTVEFSFGEDLTLNGPPDFTVHLGCELRLRSSQL